MGLQVYRFRNPRRELELLLDWRDKHQKCDRIGAHELAQIVGYANGKSLCRAIRLKQLLIPQAKKLNRTKFWLLRELTDYLRFTILSRESFDAAVKKAA